MHSTLDVMYTSMRNSVGGVRNGYFVLAACLATALVTVAHADDSDAIVGLWVTADKDGYVEITRTGDVYEGTIVGGADETERFDERNPDPQMRDRPLLGLKIIVGLWVTADKDGYVEITRTGDVYEGTIVGGADETERFDERNPDPQMRDRPLLGLKIMQGFAYDDHQWTGGRIYRIMARRTNVNSNSRTTEP